MLHLRATYRGQVKELDHEQGPLEVGRSPAAPAPGAAVVPRFQTFEDDQSFSRTQARIELRDATRILLENRSKAATIQILSAGGAAVDEDLLPEKSRVLALPVAWSAGETTVEVGVVVPTATPPEEESHFRTIEQPDRDSQAVKLDTSRGLSMEKLIQWFQSVVTVQRAVAGSPEFYPQTARAVVESLGMDRGMVLIRRPEGWTVAARWPAAAPKDRDYSTRILEQVVQKRQTVIQDFGDAKPWESLPGVALVVASPIFTPDQKQVAGALYGCRRLRPDNPATRELEAQLVQVLAEAVTTGLARLEQEAQAVRNRVQFEQFFSPGLVQELEKNPRLLEGAERVVTILATDIRRFSRMSQEMGAELTCKLVRDVMDHVTSCISQQDGVVVDFVGDGVLAMWNAPYDQEDHAVRACRAAIRIQQGMPQLQEKWEPILKQSLEIGVGVNTGPAFVGNTGSQRKFKYGPLGETVNLGSRIEGATKQLGVATLIAGSTRAQLSDMFMVRRLFQVRMLGFETPMDLFELHGEGPTPEWDMKQQIYEKALGLYERRDFFESCRTIYPLMRPGEGGKFDVPSLTLASMALQCLKAAPEAFDGSLRLDQK